MRVGGSRVLLVPVLLGALLAGCAGEGDPKTVTVSSSQVTVSEDLATVGGTVLDDSALPVEGVDVTLTKFPNLTARTDAVGEFALYNVPPGSHILVASKLGYESSEVPVVIGAGEENRDLQVTLVPVPSPTVPETVVQQGEGFISCSATTAAYSITYTQPCGADPNNQPIFEFEVEVARGLVGTVVELTWTPTTSLTGQELRLALWKDPVCTETRCDSEKVYGTPVQGASPLKKVDGNFSQPLRDQLNLAMPTTLGAAAIIKDAAEVTDNPVDYAIVWQQPVEFWVSIFYNREPTPDYSALPSS